MIWHLGRTQTTEGCVLGMLCATTSIRYAWTGRAALTMDTTKVSCLRCLAKMEKLKKLKEKIVATDRRK